MGWYDNSIRAQYGSPNFYTFKEPRNRFLVSLNIYKFGLWKLGVSISLVENQEATLKVESLEMASFGYCS